ncbi:MAG: molybdopterin-dependent oxidoreductase [Microthrixaceae bacterium]|nr:molybdopterin-dependent oxidoreductase [Acidimicrobiales bacterium]MCB9402817.1 molybdopterin-dependent oxidoreductase [Microthrixaceae bacterium]
MHQDTATARASRAAVVPRGWAAGAGFAAAAAALAAGELVAGVAGGGQPSPVAVVGSAFIDRFAASLKEVAVALFGTNDKAALVVGIVVISLALGALLGVAARRRFAVGVSGFVVFGAVGFQSYRTDELARTATGLVASLAAVAVGISVLWALLSRARVLVAGFGVAVPPVEAAEPVPSVVDGVAVGGRLEAAPTSAMVPMAVARRAFLATSAAVVAAAGVAATVGRRLASAGSSEAARSKVVLPRPTSSGPAAVPSLEVARVSPYITPNEDFYRIDTALTVPQVDLATWRLRFGGRAERPFELTYDDLLALESVEETVTLSCVSNRVGGDLVGNAVWQGVPLGVLLERAGVPEGLRGSTGQVVGRSLDGWTAGFPMDVATDGRVAMVAYAMNGEPLPVRHGFPARLVVAGLYGYVSATKWLDTIEVTGWDDFDGYWVPRGWSKEGPIKTMSRIDVPGGGAELKAGLVDVAGVAWAPSRGISTVEVRIDDGPWRQCELGEVASENTWVQWRYRWRAPVGDRRITVRATDGDGETQTPVVAAPAPDGATGWHSRTVKVSAD